MTTITIVAGSSKEILSLVQKSKEKYGNQLHFKVYDVAENIDQDEIWEYILCDTQEEMLHKSVSSVASGDSQILLKGNIQTHAILKEVLKKEHNLKTQALLSHVALVYLPELNRPVLLTDSGMNITPDEEQLEWIIKNAIKTAQNIGLNKPKVALLSAAENFNPKMPSSVLAKNLTERFKENKEAIVYGPLSLDLSLSKEAVKHKQFKGPIEGNADIIVAPNIDTGNVLYKSLLLFGNATMGGTIVGTKVPIVLTSRSDEVKSKLQALEFALKQIEDNTN